MLTVIKEFKRLAPINSPTSSMGGLSHVASGLVDVNSLDAGLPLSSRVTAIGSRMDRAVSYSAASEQENTSRLCRLQDSGHCLLEELYESTAVLCKEPSKETLGTLSQAADPAVFCILVSAFPLQ